MRKRVVTDTNVLISALIIKSGNSRRIFKMFLEDKNILIESEELLVELRDVLLRPKFNYITIDEKENFIKRLTELCEIVKPKKKLDVMKEDPDDNLVLETAVEGKANYIISGDEHLLKLKEFRGIKIVSPKEFLDERRKIK